jgi:lipopolysaccharide biosynthesis glycosyltransferase
MKRSVFIGFDPRECDGFAVTRASARTHLDPNVPIRGLVLSQLRAAGLYTRPTSRRDGRLWDDISGAPMSTEFSLSRFYIGQIEQSGWALFLDADFLVRGSLAPLFDQADPSKAVMVVQHDHRPDNVTKMDGQAQTKYLRKNWSSAMLLHLDHPSNRRLTLDYLNSATGRQLHAFDWLEDHDIGNLDPRWNYLVGYTKMDGEPVLVHFTEGVPSMPGYENCEFSGEWRQELERWAQ